MSGNEEEASDLLAAEPTEELRKPYNVAPTQPVPVIRQAGSGRAIRGGPVPVDAFYEWRREDAQP